MPIIDTRRADIASLTGLHLWHAAMSNCSQRVRMVLEEKNLAWTSHPVDLLAFEHASAEYQSIHPKGLVPTLVHDGRTVIDSNDIIRYLDTAFPPAALVVADGDGADLFALADASQLPLRTVSHELLLGEMRRLDRATLERFGRDHGNREFYAFLHRFSTEGFDDDELARCFGTLDNALAVLEARLKDRTWLCGDAFSLADISWVVNVHRLALMDYPLHRYPRLSAWFAKTASRPSYERALLAYESRIPTSRSMQQRREKVYEGLGPR